MENIKTAFITGANRGIGLEIARQLAARGCAVILGMRKIKDGRKVLSEIQNSGAKAWAVQMDVSDDESIRRAVKTVRTKVKRLDILINNAGIFPDAKRTILKMDRQLAWKALNTNALGPVRVTQAFLPILTKKTGRVINLSSGLGALSDMGASAPSYSISKTALNAVTRQFAAALKKNGISVNSMCPGWVRTDMGGPNASRSVEQGADTAVWLALMAPKNLTGNFFRDRKKIPW